MHVVRVREGADDDLAGRVGPPAEHEAPAMNGGVPRDDYDASGTSVSGHEGVEEGAGDGWPQGPARLGVVLENSADEHGGFGDDGGQEDRRVVHRLAVSADDRGEESDERQDVGQPGGVVLDATAEGGKLRQRSLAAKEKVLEAFGKAGLLLGWYGDRATVRVDDHAGVDDALRRKLPLVVTKAESERCSEVVPVVLRSASSAGGTTADGTAAKKTGAGRVGGCLGDVDGVVYPHDAVDGLGMQATSSGRGGRAEHGVAGRWVWRGPASPEGPRRGGGKEGGTPRGGVAQDRLGRRDLRRRKGEGAPG